MRLELGLARVAVCFKMDNGGKDEEVLNIILRVRNLKWESDFILIVFFKIVGSHATRQEWK